MTQSTESMPKLDRLSVFFEAFELTVSGVCTGCGLEGANLYVTHDDTDRPSAIIFSASGKARCPPAVVVSAKVDFGGAGNPVMNAMADVVVLHLEEAPMLRAITDAFVGEARQRRCGRQVALNRLGEIIVLLILRSAIDTGGAAGCGLLAGLAHPELHRVLVALHDAPGRAWRVEELASQAGMSRSRFMTVFRHVVGTTPAAYLRSWRLVLGRRRLERGGRVKSVARQLGFGSAAAFSRAYSREFGHPPVIERRNAPTPRTGRL